ncbi:MAG: polysaccharide pyruvyl transferase family protein [Thermotogae bacterium]|nr:polysaccharide pyruvyl transferase family protein [Thermotogota bacterium]
MPVSAPRGLLIAPTNNIGDDIQAIAALNFIKEPDYYINRECLGLKEKTDTPIKVIMNGWFMHRPFMWPPSDNIQPLFTSFHIADEARKSILSKKSLYYLKQYEPIGARDLHTLELLNKHGIASYFSGCLTLTLSDFDEESSNINPKPYILAIDLMREAQEAILASKGQLSRLIGEIKFRTQKIKNCGNLWSKIKTLHCPGKQYLSLYSIGTDINCLINTCCSLSVEKRLNLARERIREIQRASLVITSRLHVALPAISYNRPLIFVVKNKKDMRFKGYEDILHPLEWSDVLKKGGIKKLVQHTLNNPNPINLEKLTRAKKATIEHIKTYLRNEEQTP